nr:transcriptional regulator [uncultured Friedmanniella sp.]
MSEIPAGPAALDAEQARRTLASGASAAARLHRTSTAPEGWLLLAVAAGIACYFAASFLGLRAPQITGVALVVLLVSVAVLGVALPFLLRRHRTIRPRHFPGIETAAVVAAVLLGAFQLPRFRADQPQVSDAVAAGVVAVLPLAACGAWLIIRAAALRRHGRTEEPPLRRGDPRFTILSSLTRVHSASPESLGAAVGLAPDTLSAEASTLEKQGLLAAQERLISPRNTAEVRLTGKGRAELQEQTAALRAAAGTGS